MSFISIYFEPGKARNKSRRVYLVLIPVLYNRRGEGPSNSTYMQLLEPQAFTVLDKIKNICLVYVFKAIWYSLVTLGISFIFPSSGSPFSIDSTPIFITIIFGIILTPLWEELAFRYIPITFAKLLGQAFILPTIFLSSLMFGFGHPGGMIALLLQGVGGFIYSILYIRNNYSYWSTVTAHAMWNITTMLIL